MFGLVGVTATLTHYLMALASHEFLGLSLYVCNLIGYACAVGLSYIGHSLLTFRVDLCPRIFRRFVIVSVATFASSEVLLAGLETAFDLPHRFSLGLVVLTIPVISFVLNKLWVYRHPEERDDPHL